MARDAQRLRRLRQARVTGVVPADLVPWLLDIAEQVLPEGATDAPTRTTPAEQLADDVGDEVTAWMAHRKLKQDQLGVSRRTVARLLSGGDVYLSTVAELADALHCRAVIHFEAIGTDTAHRCATSDTHPTGAVMMDQETDPCP